MSVASGPAAERWQATAAPLTGTARHVAALFAVDPVGTGGVVIRALATPARDAWLKLLIDLLPEGTPMRRVPLHINDERLLGGLDLAATLQAGPPGRRGWRCRPHLDGQVGRQVVRHPGGQQHAGVATSFGVGRSGCGGGRLGWEGAAHDRQEAGS